MPDNPQTPKTNFTPDWLVQGVLTKLGDAFDRLTGRGWKPSSSLATSELIERMKKLLDSEVKQEGDARFVPHHIKLKMQWDKFSIDSEAGLRKLEHELLTAAVDHINDRRYYTYAPLKLEVKPDYFTSGVKLFVNFDKFDETMREGELNVTVPAAQIGDLAAGLSTTPAGDVPIQGGELVLRYHAGENLVEKRFELKPGTRLSIGRTKENDIAIDHTSVSKMHAALVLNSDGKLLVADTGSTNGTYLNGQRIAYGKGIVLSEGDKLKLGGVDVELEYAPIEGAADAPTEAYTAPVLPVSAAAVEPERPGASASISRTADRSAPAGSDGSVPPASGGGPEDEE